MGPRLNHKKSRNGCKRCKSRRVKCDEIRPACSNCTKHGISCEYNFHIPFLSDTVQAPIENNDSSLATKVPMGLTSPYSDSGDSKDFFEGEERRQLELHLLHHYMIVVTYTFPACNEQRFRDLWTIDAVRSGFKHPFLLNAILAISSLHLLSDTRFENYFYARDENQAAVERVTKSPPITELETSANLAKAHRLYLNLAVRQQREVIPNLDPSNVDAVFMTSLLLSYQSLKLIPDQSNSPAYLPPILWLKMCKAVIQIIQAAQPMIQSDSVISVMLAYSTEPDLKDEMAMFNPLYRKPFEALLDWNKYPEPDFSSGIRDTYERTLAYVGGVYRALLNKEAPRIMVRRIVCLGILAPTQYIELLELRRPRALAILAHHLALSQAVEEHWWFHGVADRVVNGIQTLIPPEWQWAMEWPLSMIRVAIPHP